MAKFYGATESGGREKYLTVHRGNSSLDDGMALVIRSMKTSLVTIAIGCLLFLCPVVQAGTAPLASHGVPQIEISPNSAFIDRPVKIGLRNFPARQLVDVQLFCTNVPGQIWQSHAEFLTDHRGNVDLATQTPRSGTYRHADSAGLFWSSSSTGEGGLGPWRFELAASVNGRTIATGTLERYLLCPGVRQIQVRDHGIRGTLFLPAGKGPWPTVIVLGGSEGGMPYPQAAAFLAAKGYAAFALAYFRYDDLPTSLENIPLEYFQNAIHWLQARNDIKHNGLAVMGGSRGGELALLLGATFPEIHAVAAISASGVLWEGLGTNVAADPSPAWTYQGKPLPFMGRVELTEHQNKELGQISRTNSDAANLTYWLFELDDDSAVAKASIPVEKINGPILLISGNNDNLWPSTQMEEMVMKRLKEKRHPFPDRHLAYPGVGHFIPIPNVPTTSNFIRELGGDPELTAAAAADSWLRIIDFLNQSLERSRH
jgi:dienelactone hydrolase